MSLYNKLAHVLTHYSINELGILPCAPAMTGVPPSSQMYYPLLVVECKLGISLDDLGHILQETQEKITKHRQQQHPSDDDTWELVTRIMVLLKPEHYTAMNARKQLVVSGQVTIQDELKLNQLIFTIPRNTKSSIAWYHREWLFSHNNQGTSNMDLENELALCQRSITLYPRNYYAWSYRHWLLTCVMMKDDNGSIEKVHMEYQTTCQWLETNISDHTGIRYMEKTLEIWILAQQQQQQQQYHTLEKHMIWLDDLLLRYPGHESLWCHRRYCASLFFQYTTPSTLHQWLHQQHMFLKQLLDSHHRQQEVEENDKNTRVQQLGFAAKFGLWLCFLEAKQLQADGSVIRNNSLVDFYLNQIQQLDDMPMYLHYLKQLWLPSEFLQGQDITPPS